MWSSDNKFWIGRHTELDVYVVISRSEVEMRQNFYIDVLYLDDYEYTRCVREFLRGQLEDVNHIPKEVDSKKWYLKFEESKKKQIKANHIKHLESHGIDFMGTRERSKSLPRRLASCWSCKCALDSDARLECCGCGWILCSCGGCGCGYREAEIEL